MKYFTTRFFPLIILMAVCGNLAAQNVLRGTIKDDTDGFNLPYAQIKVNCLKEVIIADLNGAYKINISQDTCEVEFVYSTYNSLKRQIIFSPKSRDIKLDVKLSPAARVLDPASVTASRYDKNPETATISTLVLTPLTAETKGITSMDGLINSGGGVAVIDNEPQVRGGSGFSSGMGSRVMILVDDMPLLRADAGRPMWNFIPMEDVEQVEVIKGAASVVFGSSAITGAINVRTAYPRLKPKTKVILYAGIYSPPKDPYKVSWNGYAPLKMGASFLHSRQIKKNFDLVIGGEFFNDQGYIGPEESVETTRNTNGDTKGKYEIRGRFNFATRYRFQKVKGLSVSLNANFMYSDNAQSFFWYDSDTNMFRTYTGSMSQFKDFSFYVDPSITYIGEKGSVHVFRNRITTSDNHEVSGDKQAQSTMVYNEYQYTKHITKIGMSIIAGMMNLYATSYGTAFNGDHTSSDPVFKYSDNFAPYLQLEQKFFKKKNLTVQLGLRWEFYKLDDINENKPIFRAGVNYQIPKTKTSFRASIGQGYRYPSIGERYIAMTVGKYGFYPNSKLVSESSWNTEIGIVQPFSIFDFRGMIDVAVYNQEFDDYIEFDLGTWGTSSIIINNLGFKFLNTGPARITGVDFSVMGEGKISRNITYNLMASYTYSHPVTKDRKHVFYKQGKREFTFLNTSSDTTRNVLKYRIEHMVKFDLDFTFYKKFSFGFSGSYLSAMKNLDNLFFDYDAANPTHTDRQNSLLAAMGNFPFKGFYNYFQENKTGSMIFDVRVSYIFNSVKLSFIVKNVFNKEYTLRPMYIEPLRTATIQFIYNLN